jgi:hypothetical protein
VQCRPGIIRGMGRGIFIRGIGGVVRGFSERTTGILGRRIEDCRFACFVLAKNPVHYYY